MAEYRKYSFATALSCGRKVPGAWHAKADPAMATSHNGAQAPVIPIVSSSASGPLGICHLPRMWLKVLLHAQGRLPAGYRHGTGGMDETTAANMGFDRDAFIDFVSTKAPTYLETEAWVRENAKNLTPDAIRKHNETLLHRDKPALMAKAQRAFVGLDDERILDGTLLNDLDDWHTLYTQLTTGELPRLQLSSFNAEMTEALRGLLNATHAQRVAIHVEIPAFGMDISKASAEAKDLKAVDGKEIARSEIVHAGKPAGFIAVFGTRAWNDADAKALERATACANAIIDEISLTPV